MGKTIEESGFYAHFLDIFSKLSHTGLEATGGTKMTEMHVAKILSASGELVGYVGQTSPDMVDEVQYPLCPVTDIRDAIRYPHVAGE